MNKGSNQLTIPKAKIFLVEDEIIVAEDIRDRLIQHGYQVFGIETSGQQAIEKIKETRPDLIIMDVRIAGDLNGIEVAIIVQSYFDSPPPVIFITGLSQKLFDYLKVVPDYIYLNKPFEESTLMMAIERALHRKSSQ